MLRKFTLRTLASTATTTTTKHSPPKRLHGITGRYAGAVYTAASKVCIIFTFNFNDFHIFFQAGILEKVESELLAFSVTLDRSPNFAAFLSNPTVPRGEKANFVTQVMGNKFSNVTTNLLLTLSANGRLGEAAKVVDAYCELMDTVRGQLTATVISAKALTEEQRIEVEDAVSSMLANYHDEGKDVEIIFQEDESILGGLKILVGDQVMDLSIAARMTELDMALEGSS